MRSIILAAAAFLVIAATILGAVPGNRALDRPAFAEDRTKRVPDGARIKFPDVKEIESMVADVYCHPFEGLAGPDFSVFEIPEKHYADGLKYFENCEPDTARPSQWSLSQTRSERYG